MSSDFNGLLESAFPKATWSLMVRAEREGIALADDARRSIPFLNNLLGLDLRGQLRRIGVMYIFQKYCTAGDLPFTAEVAHMPHGTWHWLNLRSGNFVAHVARTDAFHEVPEDTKNRQHYLVKNDYDLFSDKKIISIAELQGIVPEFYAYLTFGAAADGDLTHSTLGMAASDALVWLGQHDLLRFAGEDTTRPPEPAPKFDPKDRIKFNEQLEEFLKPERGRSEDEK